MDQAKWQAFADQARERLNEALAEAQDVGYVMYPITASFEVSVVLDAGSSMSKHVAGTTEDVFEDSEVDDEPETGETAEDADQDAA